MPVYFAGPIELGEELSTIIFLIFIAVILSIIILPTWLVGKLLHNNPQAKRLTIIFMVCVVVAIGGILTYLNTN